MKSYIYLASPYTAYKEGGSFDEALMKKRYEMVTACFHKLVAAGLIVYCPITMTHTIDRMNADLYGNRISPIFWYGFDKPFMQNASMLFVLQLPGWGQSEGVKEEIGQATARNIPIVFLEPNPT